MLVTPHQNHDRRNNKHSPHRRANDVWNDTESLVAKPGSKYELDQHCANSGRDQLAQRRIGGTRFHFVRCRPASRSEYSKGDDYREKALSHQRVRHRDQSLVFRKEHPQSADSGLCNHARKRDQSQLSHPGSTLAEMRPHGEEQRRQSDNACDDPVGVLEPNVRYKIIRADQPAPKGDGPVGHRVSCFVAGYQRAGHQQADGHTGK